MEMSEWEKMKMNAKEKTAMPEDLLRNAAGGVDPTNEDLQGYIKVLQERPGILDRLNASTADEEDIDCILKYFSTIDRFIYMARKFYGRSLEEIIAMIG